MAITTYAELQTAVANWLNRTDLTSRIPEFISLGEAYINRKLRTVDQYSVATLSASTEYTALPTDWAESVNLVLVASPEYLLEYVSPQQMAEEKQFRSTSGKPVYHSIIGRSIQLVPAPDTAYTIRLSYYKLIPALSASATTNWLLTLHPDIYMAATLVAACKYLRDMEGALMSKEELDEAVAGLQVADSQAKTTTTPRMRTRPI